MSKNKDLKTIDDALNSGVLNTNDFFEFDSATVEIIFGAAERMAAEIERLKKHEETSNYLLGSAKDHIDRLKAELEKRPEVVFCKNCKKRDICSQIMRFPLLKQTIKKIPVNYCSLGQRRESEVKIYSVNFKCLNCKTQFKGTFSDYGGQRLNSPGQFFCPMCGRKLKGCSGDAVDKLHKLELIVDESEMKK